MSITISTAWLSATLLLSIRIATATALTAVFGPAQIPGTVRVLLAVALGALLASTANAAPGVSASAPEIVAACLVEAAIGASYALGFLAAYAATQVGGRVLDMQMGFGVAGILNPETQTAASLIGTALGMVAVAVFLALNGHHVLIRALALSVETFPPAAQLQDFDWLAAPRGAAIMFTYGLALAGPVMGALVLADLAMAVFARSMPQLNIFVMGFALKIVLGLVGLAVSVRLSQSVFGALFDRTFRQWIHSAAGG